MPEQKPKVQKPPKPHKDYPLYAHKNGQWAKKVRGKPEYFGVWADPDAALQKWLAWKDYLLAGVRPPENGYLTLVDAVNEFLNAKNSAVLTSELSLRSLNDYRRTCGIMLDFWGRARPVGTLVIQDFANLRDHLATGRQAIAIGNEVRRIRAFFNYLRDAEMIEKPVRFGPVFKSPGKMILRRLRASRPPKFYEAEEIRMLYMHAGPILKAMILLGINCAFGNTDCSNLHQDAIDFERGTISLPRSKTGAERTAYMWPETIAALREAIRLRPKPRDPADENLAFITQQGRRWVRDTEKAHSDAVVQEFRKLRKAAGIDVGGFYWLRHTLETVGGESLDQVAVNHIMGHDDDSMAGQYRERMLPERLIAVSNHVRRWLIFVLPEPLR